jgi:asparagine N-glycosylation enzyme membrane subunit Stt3
MLFVDTASTWFVWALPALMLVFFLFPASVAVAILRHHLYDIDRLLSRTLTYGALTLVLGIVYAGAVVMLGQVLNFRGGDSSLAVAASTLLVAGLFQPLRRRIQDSVDRRFNRRRYDTAQMIAIFSARLRDEVDLDTLRAELLPRRKLNSGLGRRAFAQVRRSSNIQLLPYSLVTVVDQTMQPTKASLWLRPPNRANLGPRR